MPELQNSSEESEEKVYYPIRIKEPLLDRIRERAREDNRTITATIEIALSSYLGDLLEKTG